METEQQKERYSDKEEEGKRCEKEVSGRKGVVDRGEGGCGDEGKERRGEGERRTGSRIKGVC